MVIDSQEINLPKNKLPMMPLTRLHMQQYPMELLKILSNKRNIARPMVRDKMTNKGICTSKDRVLLMDLRWSLETLEYNRDSKELQGNQNLIRFALIKFT